MAEWLGRIAIALMAIAVVGMAAGQLIGGFAVGGSTHSLYYGYAMPDAGAGERSAAIHTERSRLADIATTR